MNLLADASLPGLKKAFPFPFNLSLYHSMDELTQSLHHQDILLCRSTLKVNKELLKNHKLRFVATASSGVDHLDQHYLYDQKITVIDAKGCNAASVADYVISCLAYLKKQHLMTGNNAAIIGVGKVGTEVLKRLETLKFKVQSYDPLKTDFISCSLEAVYECDLICIHAELHHDDPHPSYHLMNQNFINQLKPGCIIINAARGGIVDEISLLNTSKEIIYCTDVYSNEPNINSQLVNRATIATPHIAGHSLEAKYLAIALVSEQIHHALNLPVPQFETPQRPVTQMYNEQDSWEDHILSIYNPIVETRLLQEAQDKRTIFQLLRKKHQTRHNFSMYFDPITHCPIKSLLGA